MLSRRELLLSPMVGLIPNYEGQGKVLNNPSFRGIDLGGFDSKKYNPIFWQQMFLAFEEAGSNLEKYKVEERSIEGYETQMNYWWQLVQPSIVKMGFVEVEGKNWDEYINQGVYLGSLYYGRIGIEECLGAFMIVPEAEVVAAHEDDGMFFIARALGDYLLPWTETHEVFHLLSNHCHNGWSREKMEIAAQLMTLEVLCLTWEDLNGRDKELLESVIVENLYHMSVSTFLSTLHLWNGVGEEVLNRARSVIFGTKVEEKVVDGSISSDELAAMYGRSVMLAVFSEYIDNLKFDESGYEVTGLGSTVRFVEYLNQK